MATGRTLVHRLVAEAEKLGLKDAYLLTETAAPFFAALGFCALRARSGPAGNRRHPAIRRALPGQRQADAA